MVLDLRLFSSAMITLTVHCGRILARGKSETSRQRPQEDHHSCEPVIIAVSELRTTVVSARTLRTHTQLLAHRLRRHWPSTPRPMALDWVP
jgi:hypothetical protein